MTKSTHWNNKIKEFQVLASKNNVIPITKNDLTKARFFGVQIWPDISTANDIIDESKSMVTPVLSKNLVWQRPESLHFTLQGYKLPKSSQKIRVTSIINDLNSLNLEPIIGKLTYPIFGQTGIIGNFVEDAEYSGSFFSARNKITDIFLKNGLEKPTLKNAWWDFSYAFICRYLKKLSKNEINALIALPTNTKHIHLTKIAVTTSDKFIYKEKTEYHYIKNL